MGKNFLGLDGLKHFWSKAKTWMAEQITAEVTAKIAQIIAEAPENLNTLKEIADWISTHEDSASAMNTQITANKNDIIALKTSVAGKADTGHKHAAEDITSGKKLILQGDTVNSNSYTDTNPKIEFKNINGSQNVSLTFTDYDSVQNPTSITLNGNQGDEYFIAPNIKATGNFYGNLSGKASTAGTADKTVNDITIYIPYVTESGQYVIPLGNILEPTSTEINSPYNWDITGFFSIIRSAGHNGSHIQFEAGHGYSHDWTTYAYLDKLEFKGVTISMKAFQYNEKWWLGLYISTSNQGYGGKMTITYSRGLPATPTCILYYSVSNGVANKEINDSIQDIPSSWWRQRTICNPTSFSDTLYVNGVIEPRLGTYDGSIVSIGRDDGNIVIGDTNNDNRGNTVINNDCKMWHDLGVFGEGNFVGPCYFNENIFVHNKSLFPSGYIPRTYYINKQFADITDMTTEDKTLLKKFFAFLQKDRCVQVSGWLYYKVTITSSPSEVSAPGIGFVGYQDYGGSPIVIDDNNNITVNSDYSCNFCMVGGTDDEGNLSCWDLFLLADTILNNKWSKINNLRLGLTFTLLEKV